MSKYITEKKAQRAASKRHFAWVFWKLVMVQGNQLKVTSERLWIDLPQANTFSKAECDERNNQKRSFSFSAVRSPREAIFWFCFFDLCVAFWCFLALNRTNFPELQEIFSFTKSTARILLLCIQYLYVERRKHYEFIFLLHIFILFFFSSCLYIIIFFLLKTFAYFSNGGSI